MENKRPEELSSVINNINNENDRQRFAAGLMSRLSTEDNKKLFEILGDKDKLSEILNSPAAQTIMSKLNGKHQ